jgi:hypothetical protein
VSYRLELFGRKPGEQGREAQVQRATTRDTSEATLGRPDRPRAGAAR